jgi:hypothetical protein
VPKKCDKDTINYEIDFSSKEKERKSSLQKAMKTLEKKKLQSSNEIQRISLEIIKYLKQSKHCHSNELLFSYKHRK